MPIEATDSRCGAPTYLASGHWSPVRRNGQAGLFSVADSRLVAPGERQLHQVGQVTTMI